MKSLNTFIYLILFSIFLISCGDSTSSSDDNGLVGNWAFTWSGEFEGEPETGSSQLIIDEKNTYQSILTLNGIAKKSEEGTYEILGDSLTRTCVTEYNGDIGDEQSRPCDDIYTSHYSIESNTLTLTSYVCDEGTCFDEPKIYTKQ